MKTSSRLSEYMRVCVAVFHFISSKNDHDENNSNVGNLISGAVNLHMHIMLKNKLKSERQLQRVREKRQIVNEN